MKQRLFFLSVRGMRCIAHENLHFAIALSQVRINSHWCLPNPNKTDQLKFCTGVR
jgi:hypothetical protein